MAFDRHLRIRGTRNLRDLGGYECHDGRQTRWRTVLRSDCLDQLTPEAQAELVALGVRTVVDLRREDEIEAAPNVFVLRAAPSVRYVHVPILDVDPTPRIGIEGTYRAMLDLRPAGLATIVRALAEPDGLPAVVHCAAGKDRTGVVSALLLSAVGVPEEAIVEDYVLSQSCFASPWDETCEPIEVDCPPELMSATLAYLERRYGGARGYLRRAGVAADDLTRLRSLLTEPARPAAATAAPVAEPSTSRAAPS
jgi:protein-tyrosine phosphatase